MSENVAVKIDFRIEYEKGKRKNILLIKVIGRDGYEHVDDHWSIDMDKLVEMGIAEELLM
jgi:hypothetical protein